MSRPRLSIAGLMVAVAGTACGCAALARPSRFWAGAATLVMLGGLAASLLGAAFRRGQARAFWVGFALFGWGFFLLNATGWFDPDRRPLPTDRAADYLALRFLFKPDDIMSVDDWSQFVAFRDLSLRPVVTAGLSILAAWLGGILARYFAAKEAEGRA